MNKPRLLVEKPYVFVEVVATPKDFGRISTLIRIRATDKFNMRARAAHVASWDRNVENNIWFCDEAARAHDDKMTIFG